MERLLSVLLVGILVTLLYDTAGAVVSRSTGLNYGWFAFGSLALYGIFGFLVAQRSRWINGMAAEQSSDSSNPHWVGLSHG